MDDATWTITAFQKRRARTWQSTRLWILATVLGGIGFSVPFWLIRIRKNSQAVSATRWT